MQETTPTDNPTLDAGTYEIIQSRLQKHKGHLIDKLQKLNQARKDVFGSIETKLIANNRINTENNCIAHDIISFGNHCLFGYNVHFGLRTEIKLSDVFSAYNFKENQFAQTTLDLIKDPVFENEFENLYKYYRNTTFSKFSIIGNYLYMVFQVSENPEDVKTFKWLINDHQLKYIDNRSEHEFVYPRQHEFNWETPSRDMHRYGTHPHVSILDKIFVETVGGDLTIKIEDNTNDGKGIYDEPVAFKDQTLDDANYAYADLGSLTILKIKPYQEEYRYFIYNHKVQEVKKIDSIKDAAILLPDNQGVLFPNGYYLQTGEFKLFDKSISNVVFEQKISSPNGEDFIYVFYQKEKGDYVLISYNIIEQSIKTPIICNGFTIFENGELCYFNAAQDANRHHVIQIWQTPFVAEEALTSPYQDTLLFKIGNKDIVKAMAESYELITLLNKKDSYDGLYIDISKQANDIIDSFYWIKEKETQQLNLPLFEIKEAANAAVDEFEKVKQLKQLAQKAVQVLEEKSKLLFNDIKQSSFKSIDNFVTSLSELRQLRGETISAKQTRYINIAFLAATEEKIIEETLRISRHCVDFLLQDSALEPYKERISEKETEIQHIKKVINAKKLAAEINQIATDLEMLIEIVNNLDIEDTSHATKIIDNISALFSSLNQMKAALKRSLQNLGKKEATADFAAQLKLLEQSVINYLDISDSPEKCEEYLTKLSVHIEEIEAKFANYDEFVSEIFTKREEVFSAFEGRKNQLIEKRNKKAISLEKAANRILNSVRKKAISLKSEDDINAYFAADLMISKLYDIIEKLKDIEDIGKAETIETGLKTAKDEALRKLKDKLDLYEDGENVIKLGAHKFGVNRQDLELSIVQKEGHLHFHLSGTDFYQKVKNPIIEKAKSLWNQDFISENKQVYRSEYLAFKIYNSYNDSTALATLSFEEILKISQKTASQSYTEGYTKGVHDFDAAVLLHKYSQTHTALNVLCFRPKTRAFARYFWNTLEEGIKNNLLDKINGAKDVLKFFPQSDAFSGIVSAINSEMLKVPTHFWTEIDTDQAAHYIFEEFRQNNHFTISKEAYGIKERFTAFLTQENALIAFKENLEKPKNLLGKYQICKQWLISFVKNTADINYIEESCGLLIFGEHSFQVLEVDAHFNIDNLKGNHAIIKDGIYHFNYHEFRKKLSDYFAKDKVLFLEFKESKQQIIKEMREQLRLEEFKPRVLSSFVRNKLIDKVYLPLIGDNLAKQIGTVGANKRTDRMGMLLLVSPPGYGKTTLMEYLANRLGLIFMKINGPAIGHDVTSVDPEAANNSASKEELKKLNLAFEMGNNVMIYLDDIQHCNPEFLQKFISLADGQRKIEGVYNGKTKTYDFRGKKVCIIMAGNPYTESGVKFQIPDMLANRADIYNLGDVIGETADLFKLSLLENALTSNTSLRQLSSTNFDDVYNIIDFIEKGEKNGLELKGNHSKQEIEEYSSVLKKAIRIRNVVLKVNEQYIKSAAMEDAYRTEPSFKLQGSYRDMNKLIAKIVPIMNDRELQVLLLSHYENESQTLTSASEGNLLKFKELAGTLAGEELVRWEEIKEKFAKNNELQGLGSDNEMGQLLLQLMKFSDGIEGIKEVLQKGLGSK